MILSAISKACAAVLLGLILLGGVLVPGTAPLRAEEAQFVAGVEDLPLMPGLSEVPGAGVVFDKPSGRFVEAYAVGSVAAGLVQDFYAQTLPQLGWQRASSGAFQRDGERLTLETIKGGDLLTVHFTLSPE